MQGSTLVAAILDLKDDPTIREQDRRRKYCSIYVQLSRLRSSKGLHLLQKLDMQDLRFGPDPRLLTEMQRLQDLEKETIAAWRESSIDAVLHHNRIVPATNQLKGTHFGPQSHLPDKHSCQCVVTKRSNP